MIPNADNVMRPDDGDAIRHALRVTQERAGLPVVFGGLGTLLGPVIGATVFAFVDEELSSSLQLREVLYGVFVIAIFLGFKRGIVHAFVALFNRLASYRRERLALRPSRE